jgi:16S rRNA (adenine1518-N6/adenine1519-N6)-dimethyltransferase
VPLVQERVPGVPVVPGDALALDWRAVAGVRPEAILVAGNIYNISVRCSPKLEAAAGGSCSWCGGSRGPLGAQVRPGALSIGVQSIARVEKLFRVPSGAFHPRPEVDSAVVRLTPLAEPLVRDAEVQVFRRLVVGLFGFRRKQLGRGLRELTSWSAERGGEVLQRAGLSGTARPETLAPLEFLWLLRTLIDAGWRPG